MKESIHPVDMILTDGSPAITNYEPSVKINIGGAVTQAQYKFGTWYPIELAPKDGDGTLILVSIFCADSASWKGCGKTVTVGHFHRNEFGADEFYNDHFAYDGCQNVTPIKWTPLPSAPKEEV